jgi:hypothetical protein
VRVGGGEGKEEGEGEGRGRGRGMLAFPAAPCRRRIRLGTIIKVVLKRF